MTVQRCAQCNALLPLGAPGAVVTCSFCRAENRMAPPPSVVSAQPPQEPVPAPAPPANSSAMLVVGLAVLIGVLVAGTFVILLVEDDEGSSARDQQPSSEPSAPLEPGGAERDILVRLPLDAWTTIDTAGTPGEALRTKLDARGGMDWAVSLAHRWKAGARLARIQLDQVGADGAVRPGDDSLAGGTFVFLPGDPMDAMMAALSDETAAAGPGNELTVRVTAAGVQVRARQAKEEELGQLSLPDEEPDFECPPERALETLEPSPRPAGLRYTLTLEPLGDHWAWSCTGNSARVRRLKASAEDCSLLTEAGEPVGLASDRIGEAEIGRWVPVDTYGMPGSTTAFDPIEAFPWLLSFARAWSPDVRLYRYSVGNVRPDGTLDATANGEADITFFSPRAVEAAVAANLAGADIKPSEIRFSLEDGTLETYIDATTYGSFGRGEGAPGEIEPDCSMPAILGRMRLHGVPARPGYALDLWWESEGSYWGWNYEGPMPEGVPYPRIDARDCSLRSGRAPVEVGADGRLGLDAPGFQQPTECFCRMELDSSQAGDETLGLAVELLPSPAGGGTGAATRSLAYALHRANDVFLLPVDVESSPPGAVSTGALGLGLGCADGIVVVSSGDAVSAWSWSEHKLLWTSALAIPAASAEPADGWFVVDCTPLAVADGVVSVSLSDGGTARRRVADGSVAP